MLGQEHDLELGQLLRAGLEGQPVPHREPGRSSGGHVDRGLRPVRNRHGPAARRRARTLLRAGHGGGELDGVVGVDGETGHAVDHGLRSAAAVAGLDRIDPAAARARAAEFDISRFITDVRTWVLREDATDAAPPAAAAAPAPDRDASSVRVSA